MITRSARARRLAELGYVAFALDYYGDGSRCPGGDHGPLHRELAGDPLRTRAIGRPASTCCSPSERGGPGRVAAIGYCFGGTMSLELARGADLTAVVGFHSGLSTSRPEDAANIRARSWCASAPRTR